MIHLPPLLYRTAQLLDELSKAAGRQLNGRQVMSRIAGELSRTTGRTFAAEHVIFLIDQKLAPLGITTYSDGSQPTVTKSEHPFLGLRFRAALVSERATWFISGLFSWLYRPLVLVVAVTAILAGEIWLFSTQNLGQAMAHVLANPAGILLVVLLTLASAAFHEVGHAAACRYGKVPPGAMGCGIYLVWPAFYTDVTNSYRLSRSGRLRTDLGGVYFNGLFILGLVLLYLHTGSPLLLVTLLLVNMEMAQQLLPTLRFDGYYIVSDLVGIPDLFKYVGPILKRTILRRPADERLNALKRWPQIVVTVWVLTVLPALAIQLGIVFVQLPDLAATAWQTMVTLAGDATVGSNPVIGVASACVQILFLLLPLLGLVLILWQLLVLAARFLRKRGADRALRGFPRRIRDRVPAPLRWGALAAAVAVTLEYLVSSSAQPTTHRTELPAVLKATPSDFTPAATAPPVASATVSRPPAKAPTSPVPAPKRTSIGSGALIALPTPPVDTDTARPRSSSSSPRPLRSPEVSAPTSTAPDPAPTRDDILRKALDHPDHPYTVDSWRPSRPFLHVCNRPLNLPLPELDPLICR
ncbi:zinc metalloprotease [Streptomyces ureilyticus]|uniref:Peptide zinc metalloprotease protein n=1 Tax=Streptomyces ureilyticus TaxID=1775131 RepID=A0ABX0E224_9ACTN|nr:hypothetical protein [Streptomyces ureilyticus]NGO46583.1 hypothetical protein [Streptomyces ureilyticus]